ncbi:DNA repair protein RecN [Clostridium intestinale]|uniref:DNA repair protein RecN n=1 Tax=Clostridium intestinale TaxID=36845 RepID=UPI002DD624FA|nr:DNA repair protein RecN [Clostridium intestinale]WRY53363.1 DNA repair protein RecN [Clostridium intestinale]
MLLQLNIKNFALIEEMTVDFYEGFNILSGETGAGKSILIEAINYVLGGKVGRDIIRTGTFKAYVEAVFSVNSKNINDILRNLDIDVEDVIIISRETFLNGRSNIKINGKSITITILRKITERLVDIHGQHENQNLLDKNKHINYLDSFGEKSLRDLLEEYRLVRENLLSVRNKIKELNGSEDKEKFVDYLKFQIKDIEDGNLKLGEEEQLRERFELLSNSEKILSALNKSYVLLKDSNTEGTIIDNLSNVVAYLESIENTVSEIKELNSSLNETFYILEEAAREINRLLNSINYDEFELAEINERLYKISNYKKKYSSNNQSVEEVLEYYEKIKSQYDEIVNSEEIINKLKNEEDKIIISLNNICRKIREERIKVSTYLQDKIMNELRYLGLEKCTFKISIDEDSDFNNNGKDKVLFVVSTNIGEPLRALDNIVSGGELSRIMLALKTVFVDKDNIETVIFDEIDTGISGRVAQSVGEKIFEISTKHQVICITHLPQIACLSDTHYFVSKEEREGKTLSKIKILSEEEKAKEIALMVGGARITDVTLENSKEMIKLANVIKENIKILENKNRKNSQNKIDK